MKYTPLCIKGEVHSILSYSQNERFNNMNTHERKGIFKSTKYATKTAMSISGLWLLVGLVTEVTIETSSLFLCVRISI